MQTGEEDVLDVGLKGEAVDLTLADASGGPLEMCAPLGWTEASAPTFCDRITPEARVHRQLMIGALSEAGMSLALQRKVGTTLTIALNQAVNDDLIPSNPAMKVRKPTFDYSEVPLYWSKNHEFAQRWNAGSLIPAYIEPFLVKVLKEAKKK